MRFDTQITLFGQILYLEKGRMCVLMFLLVAFRAEYVYLRALIVGNDFCVKIGWQPQPRRTKRGQSPFNY